MGSYTLTYGGNTQFFINGGVRMMLGYQATSTQFNYLNLDCTNTMTLNFDMDISTLKAGTIFTMYLTSCLQSNDPTDNAPYQDSSGNFYLAPTIVSNLQALKAQGINADAQWGVGYQDAQGLGCGSCVELDLFECTIAGIATTPHGILNATSNPVQYDKGGTYMNCWGSTGFYDSSTGSYVYQNNYDSENPNPNWGPGPQFKINTLLPISVACFVDGTNPLAMRVTTRLSQGSFTLTLAPFSDPNFASPLARSQLQSMQLIAALWVTSNTSTTTTDPSQVSWWLDGINSNDYTDIRSFAQCTPQSDTPNTLPFQVKVGDQFYSDYASPAAYAVNYGSVSLSSYYGPVFARVSNMLVGCSNPPVSPLFIGWTLDGYYRGVNTDANINSWHGAYGNSYGIAMASEADGVSISSYPAAATNPVTWDSTVIKAIGSTLPTQFAELSTFGSTDANLYIAQTTYPTITGQSPYNVLADQGCTIIGSNQTATPATRGPTFPSRPRPPRPPRAR